MDFIKKAVGQLFIVGFDGHAPTSAIKGWLKDYHLGGVIYFKRNFESADQLAQLSDQLQFGLRDRESLPLFISIDHEGGTVNRLAEPFTHFAGNDHLGELGSPKIGFALGQIFGTELSAVGINVNFAPVVDVLTDSQSDLLRRRSFSSDPEVVAKLGSAVMRGIQHMGLIAVAKHFPGHGGVKEDSHFELPRWERSLEELEKVEFIPFRRLIRGRVEGMMMAHLINTAIDKKYPASLSARTIEEVLRKKLRFGKLVFSDDMEMKALSDHYSPGEAAVLAIQAGTDCLIYRGDEAFVSEAIEGVVKAVESGEISESRMTESLKRIEMAKKKYGSLKPHPDKKTLLEQIGRDEYKVIAQIIEDKKMPEDLSLIPSLD